MSALAERSYAKQKSRFPALVKTEEAQRLTVLLTIDITIACEEL